MLTVPNELALTESRTMRAATLDRTDVLDKVKALAMLPDNLHVTTELVADYYEVSTDAVKKVVERNRRELTENGYVVLRGDALREFESDNPSLSKRRAIALFTKRTILNLGQLLTGSDVAKAVRTRLLDGEEERAPASMELALRVINLQDRVLALSASNTDLAQRVAELSPKADGYDDLIASDGLFTLNAAAKILAPVTGNLGELRFVNLLRGMKIIIQESKPPLPYQELVNRGYFTLRTDVEEGKAKPKAMVTAKGLRWLQAELREEHPTLTAAPQSQLLPSAPVVRLPRQLRGGEAS